MLIHESGVYDDKADATVTMERSDLLETLLAGLPVKSKTASGAIKVKGNSDAYGQLASLIDPINVTFNIVTP